MSNRSPFPAFLSLGPFLLILAVLLAACSNDPVGTGSGDEVTAVVVVPGTVELFMDESAQLSAEVQGAAGISQSVTWSSSDEEIALVSSQGALTPVGPGSTTITAASVADPSKTGTAVVEVECREPETFSGHLYEHANWTAQGGGCVDYIVTSRSDINASLTIGPGTVVAFEEDAGFRIEVDGEFIANGTEDEKILFTGTQASAGWWYGINFRRTGSTNNLLNHVVVEYGGQDDPFNQYDHGFGLQLGSGGVHSSSRVYVTVTNSLVRQSEGYGVHIAGNADLEFSNNTLTENPLGPAIATVQTARFLDTESDYTGNGTDHVLVYSNVIADSRLRVLGDGIRYRVGRPGQDPENARILVEAPLEIDPGVELEFTADTELRVTSSGSLTAEGTEDSPILFTGVEETTGYWGGIEFYGSWRSDNVISHATVEFGGTNRANVALANRSWATVEHTVIRGAGPHPDYGWGGHGIFLGRDSDMNLDACGVNEFEDNLVSHFASRICRSDFGCAICPVTR